MFHVKPENQICSFKMNFIRISAEAEDKLNRYVDLIRLWSNKVNLVSKGDVADIFSKHVVPSFWMLKVLEIDDPKNILDIAPTILNILGVEIPTDMEGKLIEF